MEVIYKPQILLMMLCRDHSLAIINSYKELLILDLPELSKLKVNLNIGFVAMFKLLLQV